MKLTEGRDVNSSIEALGTQVTFESGQRILEPGGTLSSPWVF
jgi:threonine dehydrogenase-like Zn-dependent dehydrogenase